MCYRFNSHFIYKRGNLNFFSSLKFWNRQLLSNIPPGQCATHDWFEGYIWTKKICLSHFLSFCPSYLFFCPSFFKIIWIQSSSCISCCEDCHCPSVMLFCGLLVSPISYLTLGDLLVLPCLLSKIIARIASLIFIILCSLLKEKIKGWLSHPM